MILTVDNINKKIQNKVIISGILFSINEGKVVALVVLMVLEIKDCFIFVGVAVEKKPKVY